MLRPGGFLLSQHPDARSGRTAAVGRLARNTVLARPAFERRHTHYYQRSDLLVSAPALTTLEEDVEFNAARIAQPFVSNGAEDARVVRCTVCMRSRSPSPSIIVRYS